MNELDAATTSGVGRVPVIYRPGDKPLPPSDDPAGAAAGEAPLTIDADRMPWLRDVPQRQLAEIAIALTDFICRPAFGSRSKREIELRTFELLREHRADWTSLGEIADDLAISRSKARSLSLDFQARQVGARGRGARKKMLRDYVRTWPKTLIEYNEERLRLVIDDPFMRDLLKNFAFSHGILIDHSFAPEIQVFKWSAYAALLEALYTEHGLGTDEFEILAADLRRQLLTTATTDILANAGIQKRLDELEQRAREALESTGEKRKKLLRKLLEDYGPLLAEIAHKLVMPA